jgi:hypothetical protein
MAVLDPPFCGLSFEIKSLLGEGRRGEAVKQAAAYLRAGRGNNPTFLLVVADLLDPPIKRTRKDGRPRQGAPRNWIRIAEKYYELRATEKHQIAVDQTAKTFRCSPGTVESARRKYDQAQAEN